MPDRIEAGTFLVAAAATRGRITVENANAEHLGIVLEKLRDAGVEVTVDGNTITADMTEGQLTSIDLITAPYPGFPTDSGAIYRPECGGRGCRSHNQNHIRKPINAST